MMGASSLTMLPASFGERAMDPIAAFAPIGKLVDQPLVLAINPALPADKLQDVLDLARRNLARWGPIVKRLGIKPE